MQKISINAPELPQQLHLMLVSMLETMYNVEHKMNGRNLRIVEYPQTELS